jgi:L-aminopeptidase/D-esterase-like protein
VSDPLPPPVGFLIGHCTDSVGRTGCTAVIAPPESRGGIDVRGGGPGTRESEALGPHTATGQVTAVSLAGGSAFGLAAADGVMRWCEERGRGYATPGGLVPIVPAAIIYDLAAGDPNARPGADDGYAACEAAGPGVPERGRVGAGTGGAVGKIGGRETSTPAGIGYAAADAGIGHRVAAIAVVNAFGDVIGDDGQVLAGVRGGEPSVQTISAMTAPPDWTALAEHNTTLVCLMTDAPLDKTACSRVARMASAGIARAVDPVFSDVDGDICFCVASGAPAPAIDRFLAISIGSVAATVTAAAIRDAVAS